MTQTRAPGTVVIVPGAPVAVKNDCCSSRFSYRYSFSIT